VTDSTSRRKGRLTAIKARVEVNLQDLHREALIVYPGNKTIQILSDDGTKKIYGKDCKKIEPAKRSFRRSWVTVSKP
jgi:hypothetical protein